MSDDERRQRDRERKRLKRLDEAVDRLFRDRLQHRMDLLVREEWGGVIGVRWTFASRDGSRIKPAHAERLIAQERVRLLRETDNTQVWGA